MTGQDGNVQTARN